MEGLAIAYDRDGRRAFERAEVNVDVTFESEHNFFVGLTENISEGGLFVATHSLREVGSCLTLAFELPGTTRVIRVTCEVRWVRLYNESSDAPPGLGLRFIELDAADAEIISRFVQRRAPIFYE